MHPYEMALLHGYDASFDWTELKLAISGLGLMATPIQSCWVRSHFMVFNQEFECVLMPGQHFGTIFKNFSPPLRRRNLFSWNNHLPKRRCSHFIPHCMQVTCSCKFARGHPVMDVLKDQPANRRGVRTQKNTNSQRTRRKRWIG